MTKKLKVATVKNPTIEAVVEEIYYFPTAKDALQKIEVLRSHFICAKKQEEVKDKDGNLIAPNSLRLWIKGYDVSRKDSAEGYLGHFAIVRVRKDADETFTLYADKDVVPLKNHPQRKRPKKAHPDWGHPVLRAAKNKKLYDTMDEAQAELRVLYEEYTDIAIPSKNKLFIIIYGKDPEGGNPVQKHVLEIKSTEDGRFFIEAKKNIKPQTKKKAANQTAAPQGKFTSMVQLKRGGKIDEANASKPSIHQQQDSE